MEAAGVEAAGGTGVAGGTGTVAGGGTVTAGAAEAPCINTWCGPYHRSLDLMCCSLGMFGGHGELSTVICALQVAAGASAAASATNGQQSAPARRIPEILGMQRFLSCAACSKTPMQPSLPVVVMQPYAGHQMQHLGCLARLVRLQALATYIGSMHFMAFSVQCVLQYVPEPTREDEISRGCFFELHDHIWPSLCALDTGSWRCLDVVLEQCCTCHVYAKHRACKNMKRSASYVEGLCVLNRHEVLVALRSGSMTQSTACNSMRQTCRFARRCGFALMSTGRMSVPEGWGGNQLSALVVFPHWSCAAQLASLQVNCAQPQSFRSVFIKLHF